ncbi:hypothetical protein Sjap_016065 [Stephania japonica]|uniref:Uncharacterized protein n=1 Tax=Stephania japonica TaxID=461633 RepID=A0AAP0IKE8_9MAGN
MSRCTTLAMPSWLPTSLIPSHEAKKELCNQNGLGSSTLGGAYLCIGYTTFFSLLTDLRCSFFLI